LVADGYGLAFAMFSAAMTFTVPAGFPAFCTIFALAARHDAALGICIYLLHFIFLIWMQYIVFDPAFPASSNSRSCSPHAFNELGAHRVVRKIPVVARTI